jgi:signal transduction histidine kinase
LIEGQLAHEAAYGQLLVEYCRTHSEETLYRASLLSRGLIELGLGPDEIVAIHFDAVQAATQDARQSHAERIRILNDAHQFLLEVMIAYGAQYKEFLDLKLAEAIRRAESAEHGQREKVEILAMIAHELGNPLTIALGNMQLALRYLDTQDLTNLRSVVGDSREALERLASLTEQLVSASKGDTLALDLEPVDLRRVVTRALPLTGRLAEDKAVRIDFKPGPDPAWVQGDEEAIRTIVINLLSNAVRYTPSGGEVRVSTHNRGNCVALEVADTGIGMTEDSVAKIFDKFYRSEEATKIEPRGLGMGLNIVDHLVKAHEGWIEVESQPQLGSTFRVLLPAMELEGLLEKEATDHGA